MNMKEKYYLVILGDIDNSHFDKMLSRLDVFSEKKKIFNNLFICKDTENTDKLASYFRDYICGEEAGYCIVIYLDDYFSAAWSLQKNQSDFLTEVFKQLHNGEKD